MPHFFPNNPYVGPSAPIPHKVWILDCKSCNTFLTNRAMKAVLLLLPSVLLFSSDALPVNCSPTTKLSVDAPGSGCLHPESTNSYSMFRKCECLTQSLFCQGCGSPIGYMIIIACVCCTEAVTSTNRVTNGHRFIFYSSKVLALERHYIQDEPGIIPLEPAALWCYSSPDTEEKTRAALLTDRNILHCNSTGSLPEDLPSLLMKKLDIRATKGSKVSSTFQLQPGDAMYWHYLQRSGEIPRIEDDKRARASKAAKGSVVIPIY